MNEIQPIVQRWGIALAALWLALTVFVWLLQERLLFIGAPPPPADPFAPGADIEPVDIEVAPGVSLHGWLARPAPSSATGAEPSATRLPVILYFGGNAQEVSPVTQWAALFDGHAVLAVNYRGYAGNPGAPSERALKADALALYDWLAARPDVDSARISVVGRSLGSGLGVYLATRRPLRRLILVTPYDSIAAVAARRFWFLPTGVLLRHRFDSVALAPSVKVPTLFVIAANDGVIPPSHADALQRAWSGPRQSVTCAGRGHDDVLAAPEAMDAMRDMLR